MGSPHSLPHTQHNSINESTIQSSFHRIRCGVHEHVDRFRRRHGECEITRGFHIFLSIGLRLGILRFSILFGGSGHSFVAEYAVGEGMGGHSLGGGRLRLGDEGEYGLHCAVCSEGEEVLGGFSGLFLLYPSRVVGALVLSYSRSLGGKDDYENGGRLIWK